MALIKCSACGSMISDKAERCPKCGAPRMVQPRNQATPPQPQRPVLPQPSPVYPQENYTESSSSNVLYVIIGVLAAAVLGVGGFLALKSGLFEKSDNKAVSEQKTKTLDPVIQNLINNMVAVDGGTFTMGATPEQGVADNDERPTHQVTLSSFSIGRYEVTQEEWRAVMGTNPASFNGDKCPVEFVSWNDCQAFIAKLNAMTDMQFRMPTEAEWEFAARGGNNSQGYQFAGGNNLNSIGWYSGNSGSRTKEVGMKSPNELGLYDMTGNLWEWCSDWYGSYNGSAQTNPIGPENGTSRVLRGGGWNGGAKNCRISNRDGRLPDYSSDRLGLRLAL